MPAGVVTGSLHYKEPADCSAGSSHSAWQKAEALPLFMLYAFCAEIGEQ